VLLVRYLSERIASDASLYPFQMGSPPECFAMAPQFGTHILPFVGSGY
jgi:hypothetical protein